MDEHLTLTEVADTLGIHYMTAYRYVRLGVLPATKVGSRWRVRRADLDDLDRSRGPDRSGGSSDRAAPDGHGRAVLRAPWAERYESRALAGDHAGAWSVLESAQAAGASVPNLYLSVVAPAMRSIGERWATGELDVADEHRASAVTGRALARLAPRLARRGRRRASVVLGGAPGDRHGLPVTMAADLVASEGWDVIDLGADVPADSFVYAGRCAPQLGAVVISVTTCGLDDEVGDLIATLHAELPGVPVAVGGYALPDSTGARALGADLWAADAIELMEVLDEAITT